jgi:hypothetical protein
MPGSIPHREHSTQKPDQCRRARTAAQGCPQPAGQSSSAAYLGGYSRAGADQCQSQKVIGFLTAAARNALYGLEGLVIFDRPWRIGAHDSSWMVSQMSVQIVQLWAS